MYAYRFLADLRTSVYIEIMAGFVFSIVIWYLLNFKIRHLQKLLLKMKSMKQHKNFRPIELKVFNFLFVLIIFLPIINVIISVYYIEYSLKMEQKIYTFNTVFESNFLKIFSRSFLFSAYYFTLYQFPMIATVFCCLMYYQLSKNISQIIEELNFKFHRHFTSEYTIQIFNKFSQLVDFSTKLDDILSPVSFYLLSFHIVILFYNVSSIIEMDFLKMEIPYFLDYFTGFITSLTGIFSINIFASLIQKRLLNIKQNVICMHKMYIHLTKPDNFTLQLIKYMIGMELPEMTAWSVVPLEPSLIISIISACLTFGLLSTQILD